MCPKEKKQYTGEVGINYNKNEKCWPFQGGVTALKGPCKRQIQYLKSPCIWNKRETVLQLWLSVTKLSVSNSTATTMASLTNSTVGTCVITQMAL